MLAVNGKFAVPNRLKDFSAVGYFFGKKLQHDLNVPIGIVNASWGGTPAETWTPADEVSNDAELKQAAALQIKTAMVACTPRILRIMP